MSLTKVTYSMIDNAPINVKDFGVRGDGATDDTTALQTLISASAGKILYFPEGTYAISNKLTVSVSNVSLIGAGSSLSVIKRANASAENEGGISVSECNNVTIKGIGLDGNRANQTNTCSGLTFESAGGGITGVYLEDVNAYSWGSSDNNPSTAPFAAGIQAYSATDVTILRCLASDNGHYGITHFECENITITECQSNENLRHGFGGAGTFRFVVANNLAVDNGQQGIWYRNCEDGVISGNVVRWNTASSSTTVRTGIILKQTSVPSEAAGNNICQNVSVTGNTIVNASDTVTTPGESKGIYLLAATGAPNNLVASGNVLDNCDHGIITLNGLGFVISNNSIKGSKRNGIYDDGTNDSTISNNTVHDCPKTAIYSRMRYGAIRDNVISSTVLDANDTYYGVQYEDRTDTVISGNEVSNIGGTNDYLHAIYLEGDFASRNLVFNNRLKNGNTPIGKSGTYGVSGFSNREWDNFGNNALLPYADIRYISQLFFGDNQTFPQILSGSGSPEGVVAARVGSLYLRTDGSTGTTLYVKEQFTSNTGWVAK